MVTIRTVLADQVVKAARIGERIKAEGAMANQRTTAETFKWILDEFESDLIANDIPRATAFFDDIENLEVFEFLRSGGASGMPSPQTPDVCICKIFLEKEFGDDGASLWQAVQYIYEYFLDDLEAERKLPQVYFHFRCAKAYFEKVWSREIDAAHYE